MTKDRLITYLRACADLGQQLDGCAFVGVSPLREAIEWIREGQDVPAVHCPDEQTVKTLNKYLGPRWAEELAERLEKRGANHER